ncbi:MAG: FG-GAP-like repeat-containing protein [Gemmatimonadaceae bacterium]|nr:FG-GAP-like repeat-containing protein [Gemmatimonadaceae bacterium]
MKVRRLIPPGFALCALQCLACSDPAVGPPLARDTGEMIARAQNSGFFAPLQTWAEPAFYGSVGTFHADVNGDGKADAIAVSGTGIYVMPSTGRAFAPLQTWAEPAFYGSVGTFHADVNGDGKADAIAVSGTGIYVMPSTGQAFAPLQTWAEPAFYGSVGTFFADVDGDRKADAIAVGTTGIYVMPSAARVPPPPVAVSRIVLTPASLSVKSGSTSRVVATLYDAQNNVLTGRSILWSSSSASVAAVDAGGLVLGVSPGVAMITATSGGANAAARVTVTLPSPQPPASVTGCAIGRPPAGYLVTSVHYDLFNCGYVPPFMTNAWVATYYVNLPAGANLSICSLWNTAPVGWIIQRVFKSYACGIWDVLNNTYLINKL